jgi:putative transposase
MRYIELNPVRAAMVRHPREYPWSSYLANGEGQPDPVVTRHALYEALGCGPGERRCAYRALFEVHLDGATLGAIREATNKGWVLGGERFAREVEAMVNRRAHAVARGGDRRSADYRRAKSGAA